MEKCSIKGCPGNYEAKTITHMVEHDGQTILIEGVPAEVCSICGDVLLSLETVEYIEQLLQHPGKPAHTAPVYEMPPKSRATISHRGLFK